MTVTETAAELVRDVWISPDTNEMLSPGDLPSMVLAIGCPGRTNDVA